MRKKFMAGAAVLALLMNSPQVNAEDEIVIFGGEFEEASESKEVLPPEPEEKITESSQIESEDPTPTQPLENDEPAQIEPEELPPMQPLKNDEPAQIQSEELPPMQLLENDEPAQIEPEELPPMQLLENDKPAQIQSEELPPMQLLENDEPAQIQSEEENWGDKLTFDDLNSTPEQKSLEQPQEVDTPFEQPTEISSGLSEPVEFVPPSVPVAAVEKRQAVRRPAPPQRIQTQPQQGLKTLKPRFVKLAVDDTYIYYLDKSSVEWKKMPYSTSEYMADIWIRMIERNAAPLDDEMAAYGADNFKAQIDLAREQGYQYSPEDIKVLRQQAYILEHYYLRPKTRQVQFLCELEVFGRPQNTINERDYDAKNWENLVPGSVESTIYDAAIKILGKSKGSERGHMTFIDMLEEYGRISLR